MPYFIWNFIYGVISTVLLKFGFYYGAPLSLKTFVFDPFMGGHQFGLNFASWFVPVLFLIEVINIVARKVLQFFKIKWEILIFLCSLMAGMVTVALSIRGSVWGYYRHFGCILFLFPIFQGGHFYKREVEKRLKNLPVWFIIVTVCLIQYVTLLCTKGQVAYSAVWCSGFLHNPVVPFITTFCGIIFWLSMARILSSLWKKNNLIDRIGDNTYSIMMHHCTGFFIVNIFYMILSFLGVLNDFNMADFQNSYEYRYLLLGMENGKWIYLVMGILFPLIVKKVCNTVFISCFYQIRSYYFKKNADI